MSRTRASEALYYFGSDSSLTRANDIALYSDTFETRWYL